MVAHDATFRVGPVVVGGGGGGGDFCIHFVSFHGNAMTSKPERAGLRTKLANWNRMSITRFFPTPATPRRSVRMAYCDARSVGMSFD